MKRMWELKQSASSQNVLELYIYGDVEGSYFDCWTWTDVESQTSAEFFRQELNKYPNVSEIKIYINSWGGSVFEGTAIYSQLKRHPAKKTVFIDGFACSIASVIAMAGDEIIMPRNTMMMIHNMAWGAHGNASALRKAADDLDTINAAGRHAYLQKSDGKIDETTLASLMDAETWLTAEQCMEYGFADRYADEEADMSQAQEALQKANLSLSQQITFQKKLSACLRQMVDDVQPPKETINKIIQMFK